MEFCNRRELVNQTGHDTSEWHLVVLKELIDNALDECEEAGIAPVIEVAVDGDKITIADNGRGIPAKTIGSVLDYSIRVSSREAYVSPTRGAQGNALKTIMPMGYVLDERRGEDACSETVIEAHGVAHHWKPQPCDGTLQLQRSLLVQRRRSVRSSGAASGRAYLFTSNRG
jgi:hypothetical protein